MSSAVARIRKLLRLAKSDNEHEAEAAQKAAEELLEKQGLEIDDVAEHVALFVDADVNHQRESLAFIVAQSRGCFAESNPRGIRIQGPRRAARDARNLYLALTKEADGCARKDLSAAECEAWRSCFWMGFVGALEKRLAPVQAPQPQAPVEIEMVSPAELKKARAEASAHSVKGKLDEVAREKVAKGVMPEEVQDVVQHLMQRAIAEGKMRGQVSEVWKWQPKKNNRALRALAAYMPKY